MKYVVEVKIIRNPSADDSEAYVQSSTVVEPDGIEPHYFGQEIGDRLDQLVEQVLYQVQCDYDRNFASNSGGDRG